MLIRDIFTILLIILLDNILLAYHLNDQGRLKSQFRVFPTEGVPSTTYACSRKDVILCSKNLQGYHECIDKGLGPLNKCPTGTRCGCHLDGICHLNKTEACIPIKMAYPMPEKATFYYNGYTTKNFLALYPRDSKEKKSLWGVIKQDVKEGKFLQINTNEYKPHETFELIVPDGKGHFVKYMGREGHCYNSTIATFQPFGFDIRNYHVEDIKALTKDRSLQKWSFKVGYQGTIWTDLSWTWTILADGSRMSSLPVKSFFYEAGNGPLYKQYAFWDVSTLDAPLRNETEWYGKEPADHDWFSIPDICK